jgi:hypothetical protein
MKYVLLLLIFPFGILNAQKKKELFTFETSNEKVSGSLYNSIEFKDLRRDTTYLGVVQVGIANSRARVVPKEPLQQQFETLLASLVDNDPKQGKLLLTFRRFTFMEKTYATKETGFFFVRADLYENNNNEYRWISTLDTIVQFNTLDVTQKLLRKGRSIVTDFIKSNLTKTASSPRSYTLYETAKIDSIQKSGFALYNVNEYVPGLYQTYESFRDQKPTTPDFKATEKKGKLKDIFISKNGTGGLEEIEPEDYFAVVYNNVAYVTTRDGYFPLEKRRDDFYYHGFVKSYSIGPAAMFGLMGVMLMGTTKELGEFRLDHVNGSFLFAGKIKED